VCEGQGRGKGREACVRGRGEGREGKGGRRHAPNDSQFIVDRLRESCESQLGT
jgi:hypothetical protein